MDWLLTMPEWAGNLVIVGTILGVVALATHIFRRLGQPAADGEVRGSAMTQGTGAMAVLFGLVMMALGILWPPRDVGAVIALLSLIGVFAGGGAWMICAQWGVLLHYDDHGVTRRNRRRESWSSLRRIREAKFGPGAVVIFEDGKSLGLSPDNRGLEPFLIAAFEKRVPGIEALVRKPEGPSGPPLA